MFHVDITDIRTEDGSTRAFSFKKEILDFAKIDKISSWGHQQTRIFAIDVHRFNQFP